MKIQCPHCNAMQDHFWWDGLYHPDEPCVGPPNPPETVACDVCESPKPNPHHDNRIPPDMERKNLDCDLCENTGWIADGFMLGENDEVLVEQYTGPCPECAVIPTGYYNE